MPEPAFGAAFGPARICASHHCCTDHAAIVRHPPPFPAQLRLRAGRSQERRGAM